MKVICINNGKVPGAKNDTVSLTIGKTYTVLNSKIFEFQKQYSIINDKGYRGEYHSDRFILLSETRDTKLQKLGI